MSLSRKMLVLQWLQVLENPSVFIKRCGSPGMDVEPDLTFNHPILKLVSKIL